MKSTNLSVSKKAVAVLSISSALIVGNVQAHNDIDYLLPYGLLYYNLLLEPNLHHHSRHVYRGHHNKRHQIHSPRRARQHSHSKGRYSSHNRIKKSHHHVRNDSHRGSDKKNHRNRNKRRD